MKMGICIHLLFVSMLAVFIALLIVPSGNVKGSGDPVNMGGHYETPGDWTVDGLSGMYVYTSTTIIVNGNLTVTSSFTLTLINVQLLMNCPNNGTYSITVESGGTLVIQDLDDDPLTTADRSNITSYTPDGDHRFGFKVEGPNGKIEFKNSELSECRWYVDGTDEYKTAGLWIGTTNPVNSPVIIGNEIHNSDIGIIFYESVGGVISSNNIHHCSHSGIELNATVNVIVNNNEISYCGSGDVWTWTFSLHAWNCADTQISYNEVYEYLYFGMFMEAQSDLTINHNLVRDSIGTGSAIILDGLGGTTHVTYNEVYNINWSGIFLQQLLPTATETFINNNTVHDIVISDGSVGMVNQRLDYGDVWIHDNTVSNIDESDPALWGADNIGITCLGGSGHSFRGNTVLHVSDFGIMIVAENVDVIDNEVYSCGDGNESQLGQDAGIVIIQSKNITVRDCKIYDNHPPLSGPTDVLGIVIYQSTNTLIQNCEISNNEINIKSVGDGSNSNDALFENCTITRGIWTNDNFDLDQNSDIVVLNPNPLTWDNQTNNIQDADSSLTIKWYLNITVKWGSVGQDGALVRINDSSGSPDPSSGQPFTTSTNDGDVGTVKWIPLTQYVETSSGKIFFTPYWVNATYPGAEGRAEVHMHGNMEVTIQLNSIPFVLDMQAEGGATSVYRETSIGIQVNANDAEDPESALTFYYEYRVSDTSPWEDTNYTTSPTYISGQWEIEFFPPADAPLHWYDFRVRVEDTYISSSEWFYYDDMLEVLNNPPVVVNITSTSNTILRGNPVFIIIECKDVEDGDNSMGVEIQYKPPNGTWSGPDSTLNDPYFDGSDWRAQFTPRTSPTKDEIGLYAFRARCQDSDGEWSEWKVIYDFIEVLNNPPIADDLESGKASVFREIEHTWLFANVTEVEDPESDLTVEFEYLEPGIGWGIAYFNLSTLQYDAQGFWKIRFEPPAWAVPGMYGFKVTFTDLDGGKDSLVITGLVEVENNPPLAHNIKPSDTTTSAGAPDPIYLHVNGSDVEDLESELDIVAGDNDIQWQFNGPTGGDYSGPWMSTWFGSCSYDADGEFLKVPWMPPDTAQVGYYGFRARVTDMDDDKSSPYLVILDAVYVGTPPPPKMSMIMDIEEVYRTQDVVITVDVSDTVEPESELTPCMEYRIVGTTTWSELPGTPYYTGTAPEGHWEVYWTPDASLEPGTYEFQCRFENSEGEFSEYVEGEVDIAVLNNEPQVQSLVVPSSAYRMEPVYIIANGIDPDKLEEDLDPVFKYETPDRSWMVQGDSSSYFRNAPQYTDGRWRIEFEAPYNAPLGDYTFMVKFSDGIDETDWFSAIDDLTLSTNPQDPDGDGLLNDQDTDDDGDGVPDLEDAFPDDPAASVDTDNDGDPDDWNPGKTAADSTLGLFLDNDDDNDDISDDEDAFPQDPAASVDTDDDGNPDSWNRGKDASDSTTGLSLDDDVDGDGVPDDEDVFPLDSTEDTDTDGDGIGNNADDDDDGDGVLDIKDPAPLDPNIPGEEELPWYLWVILALVAVVIVVVITMIWMVWGKKKGK